MCAKLTHCTTTMWSLNGGIVIPLLQIRKLRPGERLRSEQKQDMRGMDMRGLKGKKIQCTGWQ